MPLSDHLVKWSARLILYLAVFLHFNLSVRFNLVTVSDTRNFFITSNLSSSRAPASLGVVNQGVTARDSFVDDLYYAQDDS